MLVKGATDGQYEGDIFTCTAGYEYIDKSTVYLKDSNEHIFVLINDLVELNVSTKYACNLNCVLVYLMLSTH